jgi:phosphoenolpyruvate carboxylase
MQQDAPVTSSPAIVTDEAESAGTTKPAHGGMSTLPLNGLNWPLLTEDACFPAAESKPADLAALTADLVAALKRFNDATDDDPFSNPIQRVALELSRRIEDGSVSYATLEQLIQYLSADGFIGRATRLKRYVGEMDPDANVRILTARIEALAVPPGAETPVPFERFRAQVEREMFGIVMTAHPTFNLSGELMELLTTLASGRAGDGTPLSDSTRRELIDHMAGLVHRPDPDLSLTREHNLSLIAIGNVQAALRRLYAIVHDVAASHYPDRWTELTPRLITVASWVGYDLDGRSDIKWTDTLHKRLIVQAAQLRHYREEVRAVRELTSGGEDIRHTLDLLESRLALAINEVTDEIGVFGQDPGEAGALPHIQRIAQRMHDGISLRLIDNAQAIGLIDRIIRLAGSDESASGESTTQAAVHRLCTLRAEMANYGLGMAHTHVRINATQLHNAIRKTVGMETAPDDPRYRQSYLNSLNDLLDKVKPQTINFGSIMSERTSSKRLFMIVAQMLKYADATTPVRFLIAECEAAFTPLTALYYAKLFGVADKVDISPLFETEKALEQGSRVIDQLLDNPHYRAYVQARGRLCIQTGFSDAGRYLGQTPASASIERLRLRIARLFPKHNLKGVQLVIFDTHGESIGRGAHPAGFEERLSYTATPYSLEYLADNKVDFKQEVSFQGGDGFLYFVTPAGALAVITRILEHMFGDRSDSRSDPFYEDPDYITEFFTTVKEFQVSLVKSQDYATLLGAFGTNLLYPSGSRAIKRQHDGNDDIEQASVSQIRAIPHNAILQQLGLPANTISGVGEAIDKDPERFRQLYTRSNRFRQLIGMVEYGAAISSPDALRAYVDTLDPGLWLLRAAKTPDRARAEQMRRLAGYLEDTQLHARQTKVGRKLFADFCILRNGLNQIEGGGCGALVSEAAREQLGVLHAVRIALIHEIFLLATHIPQFSSQHNTTHARLLLRVLHLDIPTAVSHLERIFPATTDTAVTGDFGERATYASDESQNYQRENEDIFKPMNGLYELLCRVSIGVVHRIGFFG